MATATLTPLVNYLQSIGPAEPDAALLGRFARQRDGSAFAELVRRHGPVVLGVCHRILRDGHAAEDAFQATFLLLATKAGSLRQPELLGHWLHAVAYRTAMKLRGRLWQQRQREHPFDENAHLSRQTDPDLRPDLDAAIQQLPSKYRVPVVLCYLNGLTNAEAAERVGCPPNTIATRLARARDRLRTHLSRQGLTIAVSSALVATTARNATALGSEPLAADILSLMEGVRQAMLWNKVKIGVAAVAVIAATSFGIGRVGYHAGAGELPATGTPAAGSTETPKALTPGEPGSAKTAPATTPATAPTNIPPIDLSLPEETTRNFVVTGASAEWCEKIALAAEQHRKALAQAWLGKELADWKKPCPIAVQLNDRGQSSATVFQFGKQIPLTEREFSITAMKLEGTPQQILNVLLPHEITHTILADHFREPVPRWADEGAAMAAETNAVPNQYDELIRKHLKDGAALRLAHLFPLREYPANVGVFYAQSCSVASFLLNRANKARFLEFVREGMKGNWEAAAKKSYEFDSIDDMEKSWIAYLRKTMPKPLPPAESTRASRSLPPDSESPTSSSIDKSSPRIPPPQSIDLPIPPAPSTKEEDRPPSIPPAPPKADVPPPSVTPAAPTPAFDGLPPMKGNDLVVPPPVPMGPASPPLPSDPLPGQTPQPPAVATTPSMVAVVASIDKEGRVVCKFPKVTVYEPVSTQVRDKQGNTRAVTSYVQRSMQEERGFNPGQLQIMGLDGKPVEEKDLAKRIQKETPALFITNGSLDPDIRAMLKEGSLIICLLQAPAPPTAPPGFTTPARPQ